MIGVRPNCRISDWGGTDMPNVFGQASEARLKGLHPDLVKALRKAIEISPIDFTIVEGLRSDEQCYINFGKGRTSAQCTAAGCPATYALPSAAKVTWLREPLSSNHRMKSDGFGHAVDIYPYPVSLVFKGKPKDYEPLFDKLAKAMFQAAKNVGVSIRWGADWDLDNVPRERGETDNPHFELRS
jgi:peptidoglycan L-alanyl-D-glutamate endopeptidase CwlK